MSVCSAPVRPARWLLLRGLAREKRHWGSFPTLLSGALQAEVHCLDLAGMGSEVSRDVPWSISGLTDDLRRRWRQESGPGPAGLLAVSLGGMVLMDWCTRYPQDFSRGVIVCSSAGNLSPPHHRLNPLHLTRLVRSALDPDAVARERAILSMITNLQPELETMARTWAGYAEDCKPRRRAVVKQLLAASRFRAPPRLDVPLLVLGSRGDRFVDPRCSERIATHFGAPCAWHDRAGHDLPADAPDWIIDQVRAWLDGGTKA